MTQFARLARTPATAPEQPAASSLGTRSTGTRSTGQVSARLRKLAASASTGTLPLTGSSTGVISLRAGKVVGAESSRTPGLGTGLAAWPLTSVPAAGSRDDGGSSLPEAAFVATLTLLEPTVDAVLDLIISRARCGRFRPAKGRAADPPLALPVEALLIEVGRRQRLLQQMGAAVTPDTVVTRHAHVLSPRFQVTAHQWALLIRAGTGITARGLAFELGRGVFGTTAEVYRLMALRLLIVADDPGQGSQDPVARGGLDREPMAVSFIRAVSDEKGDH